MATAIKKSSGSGSNKLGKLILGLLLVVLITGASVAGTYFFLQKSGVLGPVMADGSVETRAPIAPLPAPIFASLEPFTVTLHDERTTRILYLAITLRLVDEHSRTMVTEYMPEVRDRVLRLLSVQNPSYIQTPEGREKLVQDLTQLLQRPYLPQPRGPEISAVLFTAFVVQ
ncbi:flagellar basal body-associated FliL family protein [Achromobacter sp. F4_2707]|uniref:flagellar basal body-associated FliL family protein n=1 Tax=Achromobacter sp. F4_2707 TaxID=3114286 RepID=UPI0039C60BEF